MYFAEVSSYEQPTNLIFVSTNLSHRIGKGSNLVRQVCSNLTADERKTCDMKQFWVINLRKSVFEMKVSTKCLTMETKLH